MPATGPDDDRDLHTVLGMVERRVLARLDRLEASILARLDRLLDTLTRPTRGCPQDGMTTRAPARRAGGEARGGRPRDPSPLVIHPSRTQRGDAP